MTKEFLKKAAQLQLPAGYTFQLAGEAESEKDAFGGGFMTVVIATLFLFIMVLILEFKTFKSTRDCIIRNSIGNNWRSINAMVRRESNVVCCYYWFYWPSGN